MSIVKAAILVVGIGAVSPLAAQDRVHLHPWVSVATDPSAGVDLIFTPVITKEGACIEFRNLGSQAIHFGYYFPEWQVANQAAENGRLHLKARRSLLVPVAQCPLRIKILAVSLGEPEGATPWSMP